MADYKFYRVGILGNTIVEEKENGKKSTSLQVFTVDLTDPDNFLNAPFSCEFIQTMIDLALLANKTPLEEHLNRLRLAYAFFYCRNGKNPPKHAPVMISSSVRLCTGMYFGWREIKALFDEVNASGYSLDDCTFDMLRDLQPCVMWKIEKRDNSDDPDMYEVGQLELITWDPEDTSPFPQHFVDIPRTLS